MAMGAHFLSDVFFAAVLTIALAWYTHGAIVERGRLDGTMDRLADWLRIPRDPVPAR